MFSSPEKLRPDEISEELPTLGGTPQTDSAPRKMEPVSHTVDRYLSLSGETARSSSPHGDSGLNTTLSNDSGLGKKGHSVLLEFLPDKTVKRTDLVDEASIKKCLNDPTPSRRLFLLEGPHTDHAKVLERHFKIAPTFFQEHQRVSRTEVDHRANRTPPLPSLVNPHKTWCVDYFVLRNFKFDWESLSLWVQCAENGRRIALTKVNGRFDETGIIERKASYWFKKHENGGWDAIVVVDESVNQVIVGGPDEAGETQRIDSEPYQGGYPNFIEDSNQEPPREGVFKDLIYYCENHIDTLNIGEDPLMSTIFLQRIIASNYMMLINYIKSLLNHLSFRLSQRTNLGDLNTQWVENGWSDLQSWNWRCNEYCERIEAILCSLGVPEDGDAPSAELATCAKDFQAIHQQFLGLKKRSEMLVSDFKGVAKIVLNREALKEANRSIQEARSVRVLTVLGMLFIPLGLTSSLLSMTGDFVPGANKFWVFFAIAIPLIAIVVLLAFLVNLGYGSDRSWAARKLADFRQRRRARQRALSKDDV